MTDYVGKQKACNFVLFRSFELRVCCKKIGQIVIGPIDTFMGTISLTLIQNVAKKLEFEIREFLIS